ncbi:hypothetical protein EPK99_19120 [Neorhizobium lilium]|uniref:Antifreeze protein n=1 Tax=Neorhizobium lilium TaxID=2503024 RepID=A0A444LDF5_9HYPH|nr:hypothetical protein [Neorhizobium lilium]RWX75795.1 hypothetical protein EPK99_19120 [Neorhizobium lilium]
MLKIITKAVLAAAFVAGTVGTSVIPAAAQDLQLRVGPDGVRPVIRDRDREMDRDRRRGGCSPEEAREAARDEGFRRPQVTRVTDRSVTVQGFTRNGPDRITFANRRGCPEM